MTKAIIYIYTHFCLLVDNSPVMAGVTTVWSIPDQSGKSRDTSTTRINNLQYNVCIELSKERHRATLECAQPLKLYLSKLLEILKTIWLFLRHRSVGFTMGSVSE